MTPDPIRERILRLLELPGLIDTLGRKIVAQRADRRKVERRIKLREAEVRLGVGYDAHKTEKLREAAFVVACAADADLSDLYDRLDSVTTGIEVAMNQQATLDHERKALKAALEREYADILERALTDAALASRVSRGSLA